MARVTLNDRVPPGARFRVTYRVSLGALSARAGLQVAERITQAWQRHPFAYVTLPAAEPVRGGAQLGGLTGRAEWVTSLNARANSALAYGTKWADMITGDWGRVPLGVPLGLDARADFDSIETLDTAAPGRPSPALTGTAQQTAAIQRAEQSRADNPSIIGMLDDATQRLLWLGLVALALVLAWRYGPYLVRK